MAQIKQLLHESIQNIDDKDILLELKKITESKYNIIETPKLHKLQEERIALSKKQIKEGKSFTNTEADKKVNKWLNQ